jgi:arylsulfatase A-like enzyme
MRYGLAPLALVLGGLLACGPEPPRPRLVLLYATCTLNADFLAPYNPRIDFTPNLRRFAEEAMVFERHDTEAGQSGIAYASLFSGTQADRHQVYRHPVVIDPEVPLVAEIYQAHGYDTYFWNFHLQASPALGFGEGVPPEQRFFAALEPNSREFQAILERLARDPDYRAFVVTNFTFTHSPYATDALDRFLAGSPDPARRRRLPPQTIRSLSTLHSRSHRGLSYNHAETVERLGLSESQVEQMRDAIAVVYASNVFRLDRHFGRVIENIRKRGLLDESLVVFTADHGEVVDRDNAVFPWSHAMQLAPEVLRVPLIVRAPKLGLVPGRYSGVTRSIDVLPTMAGLSSLEVPTGIDGVDLSEALRGEAAAPELESYSHTSVLVGRVFADMGRPLRAHHYAGLQRITPDADVTRIWARVRAGDIVYKRYRFGDGAWQYSAYDLAADPEERDDLFDPQDPEHAAMRRKLDAYWEKLVTSRRDEAGERRLLPDEEENALRSLGYIE